MGQLQEIESKLKELGYQIIAVSADRPEKLKESIGRHDLTYRLLSDSTMAGAKAFGIAYKMDKQMLATYKSYDIDVEEASGAKHHMLPVPSVFIVGDDGLIKFKYVNPYYKIRLDPDVMLAAAKAALNPD